MKRAAAALVVVARAVDIEGAFLLVGGGLLAVGSSFLHPAGPWIVVGGLCLLIAVGLALHPRGET